MEVAVAAAAAGQALRRAGGKGARAKPRARAQCERRGGLGNVHCAWWSVRRVRGRRCGCHARLWQV